jgi:tripartite-type tricarboxylate transporter receptor subunit TctC
MGALLAGASLALGAGNADAQAVGNAFRFPERPVRIIVTTSAGASSDMLTRATARKLAELWGKPVVVENVPGASGNIGLRRAAEASPDGYTLVASGSGLPIIAGQGGLGFDPATAFAAITQAAVKQGGFIPLFRYSSVSCVE